MLKTLGSKVRTSVWPKFFVCLFVCLFGEGKIKGFRGICALRLPFSSFKINFFLKIVLFESARKTQQLRILRGKLNQNVIFCVQTFFKIVLFKNNFFSKIVLFENLLFCKIMLFLKKNLIQNLTRRKVFISKSDAS